MVDVAGGLNPSIPLGVRPVGAGQQTDPFETMSRIVGIQNALNQNRLFQQTFMARQKAGQIIASAPDLETGLTGIAQDPDTAAFAGQIGGEFRQMLLALTQQQGAVQEQSNNAITAFMKRIPALGANPTDEGWQQLEDSVLATTAPYAKAGVATALSTLKKSLLSDLPADPAARRDALTRRYLGIMAAGGAGADTFNQIYGTTGKENLGPAIQPTLTAPAALGGGERPVGPAFGVGPAPTYGQGPGSTPLQLGGPPPGTLGPQTVTPAAGPSSAAPGFNALGGAMPGPAAAPAVNAAPAPAAGAAAAPTAVPQRQAGDGKPLFPPGEKLVAPTVGRGMAGLPLMTAPQVEQANKLQQEFNGDDAKEYKNAVASMSSLDYIDQANRAMTKQGGTLAPGAFADARVSFAKGINTLAGIAGIWDPAKPISKDNKPPFDPATVASAEDFQKTSRQLAYTMLNQLFGGQREAVQTIAGAMQAIPSIENTPLGSQLVSTGIRAAAQRVIDRRQFQLEWSNRNNGILSGAAEAFDRLHPAEDYAQRVLEKFGLNETGFASPDAVKNAYTQGWLDKDQAAKILADQFPKLYKLGK